MVKKIVMLSLVCGSLSAWAANTSLGKVDGVTQATVHNNIKFVLPLTVAADSAIIKWTDAKSRSKSGTVVLTYGIGEGATTERPVTSAEASSLKFTLKGLTAKTTYKIRLQVSQASGAHGPCADTATISTLATTFSNQIFSTIKNVPIEMLDHSLQLGTLAKSGDHVTISDCRGRMLLDHKVKGDEKAINLPSKVKGVYFLKYSREGKVLDQKQFVIIHK
jgi:hypothetical protein